MRPAFCNGSVIEHINMVGAHYIGKPVGNEDHRFAFCQLMDFTHNIVFALHINVGGGFIKNINRAVVQKRPCKRQPLALPAGEV